LRSAHAQARFIVVGVLLVAAICATTAAVLLMQRTEAIDDFQIATKNLGNGMAQQTTQALAGIDRALDDVAGRLAAAGASKATLAEAAMRSESMHEFLANQAKSAAFLESIWLVDADGGVVNSSGARPVVTSDVATDVSGRDFYRHFLASGDRSVFIGAPTPDPTTGRWTVPIARPVHDAHDRFCCLVVGQISLSDLETFYHLAMPAHRALSLARSDGLILLRYPARNEEVGRRIPDESPWHARVADSGGSYLGTEFFDPAPLVVSVHPLRGLPLVVAASVLESDALLRWEARKPWVVLGGILAAAAVLVMLHVFARQYRRLERSEQSLASKNGELDLARRELEETLGNLSQGVCLFDSRRRLLVFNDLYCELYGLPPDALQVGMTMEEIIRLRAAAGSFPAADVDGYVARVYAALKDTDAFDAVSVLTSGKSISVRFQPLPDGRWVATHEDITQRRADEARILFLAQHDALTGLANRNTFHASIEKALLAARRGDGFAVLYLDLDRFKSVNDTYGHPVGDSLLRAVTERLLAQLRNVDMLARLGGDEFAILLHRVSAPEEATIVARRIVESVQRPFEVEGRQLNVGVSIGVALACGAAADSVQIMKDADVALYRAKREGRGTWRFFEQAMDAAAQDRGTLEADLRRALPMGQLELHYQPLVGSQDRRVNGFEVLLRWRHPTRGVVPPVEFISLAEDTGLIVDIGGWVLRTACAQATAWPAHVRVAVNLSPRQFRAPSLVDTVAQAIQAAGIAPWRVDLEITESVPLLQNESTLGILLELHRIGVRIVLDDFGTGYSSLSYLRSFPFQSIKIDRSFVSDLDVREEGKALINGIIGLATNLRMDVTAEGVETEEQFAFLAGAGCKEIQGYLISRPVPADECAAPIARPAGTTPGRDPEPQRPHLRLLPPADPQARVA